MTSNEGLDRREFLQSAGVIAATAGAALGATTLANAQTSQATAAATPTHQGPMTKRWIERRWTLDRCATA